MREKFFREIRDFRGLNVSKSPLHIEDNEFCYVLNAIFDNGIIKKRPGLALADFRDSEEKYRGSEINSPITNIHPFSRDAVNFVLVYNAGGISVYREQMEGKYVYVQTIGLGINETSYFNNYCFMDNDRKIYLGVADSYVYRLRYNDIGKNFTLEDVRITEDNVPVDIGSAKYITSNVRRLFLGNILLFIQQPWTYEYNPNRLYFSKTLENTEVPVLNYRVVNPTSLQKNDDYIKGLVGGLENKVIIFQGDGIHTLTCEGDPQDWVLKPVSTNYGLAKPYAYALVEGNIVFLSKNGLKIFDGANVSDFPTFPLELFTSATTKYGRGYRHGYFDLTLSDTGDTLYLSYDPLRKRLYLMLQEYVDNRVRNFHCLVYDFEYNYWSVFKNPLGIGKVLRLTGFRQGELLTYETLSATRPDRYYFVKQFRSDLFSDEKVDNDMYGRIQFPIEFKVVSKRFSFNAPHFQKIFQRIFLITNTNAGTLTMKVIVSDVDGIEEVQEFVISTQTTSTLSTMTHEILLNENMVGRTIEFEFYNDNVNENVEIHSLAIEGEVEFFEKK